MCNTLETVSSLWLSNNWWRTLSKLYDQIQLQEVRMLPGSFVFPCPLLLIFACHSPVHRDIFPIIPLLFPGGRVTSDRFIVSAPLPSSPRLRLSVNLAGENDICCICNCVCPAPQNAQGIYSAQMMSASVGDNGCRWAKIGSVIRFSPLYCTFKMLCYKMHWR